MKDNLQNVNDLLRIMYEKLPSNAHNSNILFINFYKPYVQHALNIKNSTFLYVAYSAKDKENVEMNENRYNENVDTVIMGDELEEWMKRKKFDYCIMNPPYCKTLHLHILRCVISHATYVVNLSPILWLTKRSSTKIKQFEDVAQKIVSLEHIPGETANKLFGTMSFFELGIYTFEQGKTGNIDYKNYWKLSYSSAELSILEKIGNCQTLADQTIYNKNDKGICVSLSFIAGGRGNKPVCKFQSIVVDGKCIDTGNDFIEDWNAEPKHKAWQKNDYNMTNIRFNTLEEAKNFYNSYNTKFMTWVCEKTYQQQNILTKFIPYMGDYTKPWTDERFKEYFKFTDEEWNTIVKA